MSKSLSIPNKLKKYEISNLKEFKIDKEFNKTGSYAVVKKARYKKHDYAVKILNEDSAESFREIEIMLKYDHPTIAKSYGFSLTDYEENQKISIVMEYYKNGTLRDLFRLIKKGEFDISKFNDTIKSIILIGISYGMMLLHNNNSKHRDLNPSNILLDDNFYPVIADFGLSKEFTPGNSLINSKAECNSLYMAPEMYAGTLYNRKADVYAFALIMYEVVTGYKPFSFKYKNISDYKVYALVSAGKRPLFDPEKPIKKSLKKLIECCWDQNPNKRPSFENIYRMLTFNIKGVNVEKEFYLGEMNDDDIEEENAQKSDGNHSASDNDDSSNVDDDNGDGNRGNDDDGDDSANDSVDDINSSINCTTSDDFELFDCSFDDADYQKVTEYVYLINTKTAFNNYEKKMQKMQAQIDSLKEKVDELTTANKMQNESQSSKKSLSISDFNEMAGTDQINFISDFIIQSENENDDRMKCTEINNLLNFLNTNLIADQNADHPYIKIKPKIHILPEISMRLLSFYKANKELIRKYEENPHNCENIDESIKQYEFIVNHYGIELSYSPETSGDISQFIVANKLRSNAMKLTIHFDGIETISSDAFRKLQSLKCAIFHSSVKTIGSSTFCECTNLKHIVFEGVLDKIDTNAFNKCVSLRDIKIPCKIIGQNAFSNCKLENVTFDCVEKIGKLAFSSCKSLKCIVIPKSVKTICESAFYNCELKSIEFQEGSCIDRIEDKAFACNNIDKITLPKTATYIGKNVFTDCKNLQFIINHSSFVITKIQGIDSNVKILK